MLALFLNLYFEKRTGNTRTLSNSKKNLFFLEGEAL